MIKRKKQKGSYTIEAAVYIPIILCILFQSLDIAIDFWQRSKNRVIYEELKTLDVVKEFYGYQILDELGKEIAND